ncbi:MAG: aminodeoxychorismate lyase [Rudaea sp.]
MNTATLVDGVVTDRIDAQDRGLLYGDGVFETIAFVAGCAPLWPRHMARLRDACARLRLQCLDESVLAGECAQVLGARARGVVRITLTRGSGERGYAPALDARTRRIVAAFAAVPAPADWYARGIRVRFCATRLAQQPALAGIKHLNRLEQVLARAEWNDAGIAEGLMFDFSENLVCATAANLFAVIGERLLTPPVDTCGVAGVARAEVLARRPDCVVAPIRREDLRRADEVFLTSSVRGIVPVASTPEAEYLPGVQTRDLQRAWRTLGLQPELMP